MLWELTILIVIAAAEEYTVTKLPSLEIRSNVAYFERHRNTLLNCTVSPGWSAARATDVYWLKDGVPVTELHELASLYHIKNGSLSIGWTRFETEGDYQCSAMVKNIELGDKRVIDTRLVSAPVNYKRARLTKFDDFEEQMIRITQEQLTRIPCFGMPDVVPSPAVMWFEKEGDEAVHLGLTSERRFVVTLTGLQIALVQPSDAGNYYCVVRNPYTNHTRRAPKPTVLVVNSRHGFGRVDPPRNSIEFPLEGRSAKNPIVIHASVGQTILLECVTSHSSVKWTKGNNTVSIFEMENPHRVYEKVWGNLRLRSLVALDSDIYVCHALSPFDSDHKGLSDGHAKVYYQLYVHVPTTAQLNLEQESDDIWRLVCYAGQQFYEVPMVYLNGFPLIDRSHILADGHERVAESNPLNVTLKGNTLKGTSVQCISRAAMVEAEVYGRGLERGEAVNFYVDVVRNETDEKQPERNESGVPIDYNATVIATLSTGEVGQVNRPDLPENRMNVATTQSSEDYASTEMKAVNSIIDRLLSISPSIGLTFVLLFVSSTVALCFIMTFCCLGCYRFKEWYDRRFSKAAKGKFLDTSQRIFNEQLLQRSRTLQEQQSKLMTPLIRHPSSSTQGNAKTALDSSISMIGHQETPSFYGSSEENHHQGSIPGEDMTESTQSFLKAGGFYKSRPGRALFSSEWHDGAKPTKNELLTMSATLPHPFSNSQGSPREYDSQSAHSGQNALSTFQSSSPFRKANN